MHTTRRSSASTISLGAAGSGGARQVKETAAAVEALQQSYPEVSYEYFINNGWIFARAEDQAKVLAAYRTAGLRLCATTAELNATPAPRTLPECDTERAKRQAAAP